MHKLGIVVPYKNRPNQLKSFIDHINDYLDIDYELIVIEQSDRKNQGFNRGKLLNIGFLKAEELGCDYIALHDVDMLPVDADYSYVDKPTHLITELELPKGVSRTLYDEYFGGVTLFPTNIFRQINGYTNKYYGWGFEDDDLLLRCRENHIELGNVKIPQRGRIGRAAKFNGKNSYIAVPNLLNTSRDFSVYTSFTIEETPTVMTEVTDEYSIWSIPGFDTALNYTSFGNFSFQFWKKDLSSIAIPSDPLPKGSYNAIVNIKNRGHLKYIELYINGEKIGKNGFDTLNIPTKEKYIFLGAGNPERDKKPNFFNGSIDTFAIYSKALDSSEIDAISSNLNKSLFELPSSDELKAYYDFKFINGRTVLDLSGNGKTGYIKNVEQTTTSLSLEIDKPIPFRKNGKFRVLPHKENGYKDGYWISWASRENQDKHIKKLKEYKTDYQNDGLTKCIFVELDKKVVNNYHHYTVRI